MNPPTSRGQTVVAVVTGALLMLATLPGRTQGLGLITEPLLEALRVARQTYAEINLWATLLGAVACLPVGIWLDRRGPREVTLVLLPALALVVWGITLLPESAAASPVPLLFTLILLTRALGQGGLSVLSIGVAGRAFHHGHGGASAAYAVLLSVLFMIAFVVLGGVIRESGWQVAWRGVAVGLVALLPLAFLLPRRLDREAVATGESGFTLAQSLRQPLFWIYSAGIALFTAVQAGIGLFNEALLVERGFDRETYHHFLAATALIALLGQGIGGATRWLSLRHWLGLALLAQAGGLAAFRFIEGRGQLWVLAGIMGISAGIITVAFFAIWADNFGKRHLGRIMGVAQTLTVLASATGPLLLERGAALGGGFADGLFYAAPVSLLLGLLTLVVKSRPLPV
jgi:MFS family permease